MNMKICAGMRVLYKENNQWQVGITAVGIAHVALNGLFIPIIPIPQEDDKQVNKEINDIFFDAFKIEDYIKDYKEYFMTKEDYIKFIENEDFDKHLENAYVSDGEYGYYPISKYNRNWIEKQPFDYVIRTE